MNNKFEDLVDVSDDGDIEPETIPICEQELTPEHPGSSTLDTDKCKKENGYSSSTSPSVLNGEKSGKGSLSRSDESRKRPRITFLSPQKDNDINSKRSRRSGVTNKHTSALDVSSNGLSTETFPSDMDLEFDESLEEEVPAGIGFSDTHLSDSEEITDVNNLLN